jgi:hypothetical protein
MGLSYFDLAANPIFFSFITTDLARQALISQFIGDSEEELCQSKWGRFYGRGVFYLTAHRITLLDRSSDGSATGTITSLSASPESQSVSFDLPKPGQTSSLHMTPWGLQYLELRSRLVRTAFLA